MLGFSGGVNNGPNGNKLWVNKISSKLEIFGNFAMKFIEFVVWKFNRFKYLLKVAFFQKVLCVFKSSNFQNKNIPKKYPELEI